MHYTISIALRRGSRTVAGALYNPVADEMFTAIRGRGAFLNGERLQVSPQAEVGLMAIGTGLPIRRLHSFEGYYSRLERIRDPIGAIRIVGSSANSCAHVACGRLTGYFEELGLVDWAVGVLLVEEAGGVVTDWWGRGPEVYERTGTVIVANAATHAYLLRMLEDAPRQGPVNALRLNDAPASETCVWFSMDTIRVPYAVFAAISSDGFAGWERGSRHRRGPPTDPIGRTSHDMNPHLSRRRRAGDWCAVYGEGGGSPSASSVVIWSTPSASRRRAAAIPTASARWMV